MYGTWTKNEVLWRNLLGFIWDMNIKRFTDFIITKFEPKVDFQNHPFRWLRFENRFLKNLLNNDDKKSNKNSTVNLLVDKEQVRKIKN